MGHTHCEALIQQHRYLNLQGVGADPNLRVELESVYVSLRIKCIASVRDGDQRLLNPLDAEVGREPLALLGSDLEKDRLVIVGDPGSGKSTFLSHLVVRFAEAWDKGTNPF